ncbi:MAG: FKBP-type peptidyl-prolyl cis-trans isomerase [Rhodothermales bacterium]|nr:FKBP-type peptidyl-prolyl cis-trans isomerase [Rhodothermales bacterium]
MPRLAVTLIPLLLAGLFFAACDGGGDEPDARVSIVDLELGQGPEAAENDTLRVAYEGRLQGTSEIFDSSDRHGGFIDFVLGVGQVIDGWERGLPGMRVGGTRVLTIPPELAYGRRGAGCSTDTTCIVPPNSTLIFQVRLLALNPADPQVP